MKFGVFVHPKRAKVSIEKIAMQIQSAGFVYAPKEPDVAIVMGGDGTFGYYGRILTIPMLFVGVKEADLLGSRARLAETMYDSLGKMLHKIDAGKYWVSEKRMLSVKSGGQDLDVLTDVYLERGEFAGCIRYVIQASNGRLSFNEYAIVNGVVVSTSYGSAGYFSHPKRLKSKEWDQDPSIARFSDNKIGICHIIPTYLIRERDDRRRLTNKIQYTVPIDYQIQIRLARDANVRLYGITQESTGKRVLFDETISISASKRIAKIIKLRENDTEDS